jgi:hypothetical protein
MVSLQFWAPTHAEMLFFLAFLSRRLKLRALQFCAHLRSLQNTLLPSVLDRVGQSAPDSRGFPAVLGTYPL